MQEINQGVHKRYGLVKANLICPDCGSDVRQTTLGYLLEKSGERPGPQDSIESIAFECTQSACGYTISVGELPSAG